MGGLEIGRDIVRSMKSFDGPTAFLLPRRGLQLDGRLATKKHTHFETEDI